MTGLLSRAAGWLIEPRDDDDPATADASPRRFVAPVDAPAPAHESPRRDGPPAYGGGPRFVPPTAGRAADPDAIHRAATETAANPALAALRDAQPLRDAPPLRHGPDPRAEPVPGAEPVRRPSRARTRRSSSPGDRPPFVDPVRAVALGPPTDALVLAAALGLTLRRSQRATAALVLLHRAGEASHPPAPTLATPPLPAARRVAARLVRRGIPAEPHGRLVWVALDGASAEALATVRRAESATGDVPSVIAIAGPRDAAADELIAGRAPVVIAAGQQSPLAALAEAELGAPVHAWSPPAGAARLPILAGLNAPSDDELLAAAIGQAPDDEAAAR